MNKQDHYVLADRLHELQTHGLDRQACGLQQLVECADLPDDLRTVMRQVIDTGFTLRSTLSGIDQKLSTEWLGSRWYLLHRTQLASLPAWASIVSSRLNRTDTDYCAWPMWLENAVRCLARDGLTVLLVPGTTTAALVEPLVHQAQVNRLIVQLPNTSHQPPTMLYPPTADWLVRALEKITISESVAYATLSISDSWHPASPVFDALPLQDRLAVCLSHQVLALSVRPRGNNAQLLMQRLQDDRFPVGTVSVRLPGKNMRLASEWLDRQAVGWYLSSRRSAPVGNASRITFPCHCPASASNTNWLMPWTTDARLLTNEGDYLIHCVRGSDDEAFRSGDCAAVVDAILQASLSVNSPYETLLKIISAGRLRASGKLLRSQARAVSFTAVPLLELMARRRYQNHLGRWDWEPFGFMIRRDELQRLGARPVVYGGEELYRQLDAVDRDYYQPARRRSARTSMEHWQAEQEWRLFDDVRFSQLSPGSVILFVQSQEQAHALAMHSPWPVIWLQASQTRRLPIAAGHRRRSSVRTSRN